MGNKPRPIAEALYLRNVGVSAPVIAELLREPQRVIRHWIEGQQMYTAYERLDSQLDLYSLGYQLPPPSELYELSELRELRELRELLASEYEVTTDELSAGEAEECTWVDWVWCGGWSAMPTEVGSHHLDAYLVAQAGQLPTIESMLALMPTQAAQQGRRAMRFAAEKIRERMAVEFGAVPEGWGG